MNIDKVIIKNLYGYLNKEINLNRDINLLVGINGSGKTSVLNVINWLLIPSFPNLCVTEFEKIEIFFTFKNHDFHIYANQNDKELTINLINLSKNYSYPQISAELKISPKKITKNNELRERYSEEYFSLEAEKHEEETWDFLFKILPNPIVIGLDRNIYTEEGNEVSYIEDPLVGFRKKISNNKSLILSPLEKVMRLSSSEYVHYKNKILELNKRLNDKIMLSSFDETLTLEKIGELLKSPKISLKQVESLEIKVREYFEENIYDKKHTIYTRKIRQNEAFN